MLKLEELRLNMTCSRRKSFVDGNDLKAHVIEFFPRLKTFVLTIYSSIRDYDKKNPLTNEDISRISN